MKIVAQSLVLFIICINTIAKPLKDHFAAVINHITSPLEFIKNNKKENYWFAYSIPAQKGAKSSCCWSGESKLTNSESCSLSEQDNGFSMTQIEEEILNHHVYVHVENSQVENIMSFSENCPVDFHGNSVTWLNDINEVQSIEFIKELTLNEVNKDISQKSLYAMALHQSHKATEELYELAKMERSKLSDEAIFWLGEARTDGVKALKKLNLELESEKSKEHILFAMTQSMDPEGIKYVEEVARQKMESHLSKSALFWLSQEKPELATEIVFEILDDSGKQQDFDYLTFILSQSEDPKAEEKLFEIVRSENSRAAKKQALFWLAQSENEATIDRLQNLLTK